jgi:Uma2 family endonuclease
MTTVQLQQKLTFDQFVSQCPTEGRYEFVDGEIVRILATRKHDNVAEFITDVMKEQVKRLHLNYRVSGRLVVATEGEGGKVQGRNPDISVVNRVLWDADLSAYSAFAEPIQLAVEVTSTNWEDDYWEDDYIDKLDEYQRLGIFEYWIVDYLALGSRTFLGNPQEPSVFVFVLDEKGQYQSQRFQGDDRIISPTFPELELTIAQILEA